MKYVNGQLGSTYMQAVPLANAWTAPRISKEGILQLQEYLG